MDFKFNLLFISLSIPSNAPPAINNIFEEYGESQFRKIEEQLILEFINSIKYNNFIMSLGGGAFINETIRTAVKNNGLSIWLKTDIEIINYRIKKTKNSL